MNTSALVVKMSEVYDYQSFYFDINAKVLNCQNIDGTRSYLDDQAKDLLLEKFIDFKDCGIHFIDSGNYHYLSLLFMMLEEEPFSLVLFDNHPDNQLPSFGDITSCGGWVAEAINKVPNMKNVYTFGVGGQSYDEILPLLSNISLEYPIYLSIDKDVLTKDDSDTDWDQGSLSLSELLSLLEEIKKDHKIKTADICGENISAPEAAAKINNSVNSKLYASFLPNS